MTAQRNFWERTKANLGLDKFGAPILIALMLLAIILVVYYTQRLSEQTSLPPIVTTSPKEQYEIAKLAAEIRQIRSDTSGSLFWLKMIALFVTVGGAVGGYLIGQKQTTKKRLEFENLKNIDSIYQSIVLELADKSNALLRAAAAVKLGMILKSFPSEWVVDDLRKKQMIRLTKQILAASLAIEEESKVLKTLTIAVVLDTRLEDDPENPGQKKEFGDVRKFDLSGADATKAYWADVDFSESDFYKAILTEASFRRSVLREAQFREADLHDAVLVDANCFKASFKMANLTNANLRRADLRSADLRSANLTNATLAGTKFEGAKVFGCVVTGAKFGDNSDAWVYDSEAGDESSKIKLQEWLTHQQ